MAHLVQKKHTHLIFFVIFFKLLRKINYGRLARKWCKTCAKCTKCTRAL